LVFIVSGWIFCLRTTCIAAGFATGGLIDEIGAGPRGGLSVCG
jgi:hypothetical protein